VSVGADLSHVQLLGHSDLAGRPDGLQVVGSGHRVFVSHLFANGFSEVDISDPRHPQVLSFTPSPLGSWSIHLQVQDGLLLATNAPDLWRQFADLESASDSGSSDVTPPAGMRIYDIDTPGHPREIGWFDVGGGGVHRIWYGGGAYALLSAAPPGHDETLLMVVDVSAPEKPVELDRWSISDAVGSQAPASLHHAIERDGVVYGAWRDGGMSVHLLNQSGHLDLQSLTTWDGPNGAGPAVHSTVPLPGLEEQGEPQERRVLLMETKDLRHPLEVTRLPEPGVAPVAGGRFGPHNIYEYRPGAWQDANWLFVAHQGAGLRVYDVRNTDDVREVAHFRPAGPDMVRDPRPARARVCQTNDVFVTSEGVMCTVDTNLGLHLLAL
jgi:hypothetical protein